MLKFGHERRDWNAAKAAKAEILDKRVRSGRGPMTYGELGSKARASSFEPLQDTIFTKTPSGISSP